MDTTLFYNGKILVFSEKNSMSKGDLRGEVCSFVDSMLVSGEKIFKLGNEENLRKFLESENMEFREENLFGKRVIPGFVDCHEHPVMLADTIEEIAALPPEVSSIEDLVEKIRLVRKSMKSGDEVKVDKDSEYGYDGKSGVKDEVNNNWILGWGCDEGKFPEKRLPDRWDLDRGANDVPVSIVRACEHIRCCNSLALKLAGIDENTKDPVGGNIGRDENGVPNGILYENARNLVAEIIPHHDHNDEVELLRKLGEHLSAQGITSIGEMGNLSSKDNHFIYYDVVKRGFRQNVSVFYMWEFYKDKPEFVIEKKHKVLDQQIHVAGLKLIGDGSFSGHTAWTDVPFLGTDEYGISTCSEELLESAIEFCKEQGLQLSFHAMGRRAIKRIVDRLYEEGPWQIGKTDSSETVIPSETVISTELSSSSASIPPTDSENILPPFARIEHVTEPSDEAIKKAAELGIAFVTQPIFLFSEIESYEKNLGKDRLKETYPIRKMIDMGVLVGLSTDAPATAWADPTDPWANIKGAVTRTAYNGVDTGGKQKITLEEAILLYTKNSARIAGFQKRGSLAEGNYADFVVLLDDPFEMRPDDLQSVRTMRTYINGEKVFDIERK